MTRGRLLVENLRGVAVPVTLGFALLAGGAVSAVAVGIVDRVGAEGWIAAAGAGLVFSAGLVDDLMPGGPRGLRGHLHAISQGHVSTGIVKLVVVTAVAVVTVASSVGRPGWVRIAGVLLLAACANLWNGLDVRPGRALLFAYLAAPAFGACPWSGAPFVPGVGVAAVLVLPLDAGERAMLGDAGANLLGFTVGVALYSALTDTQVVVAALVAVALNVVADTVTLSRVIDAVAPLRWFDRLGRRPMS
jgi:hypothetical protein